MKRAVFTAVVCVLAVSASPCGGAIPEALRGVEVTPLALASGDFDGDGVADLVAGFGTPGGGVIVFYRGNADALYPNAPEARERLAAGRLLTSPFLATEHVLALPAPPDFLAAGDFDADGRMDLAVAASGSSSVAILSGDGRGGFRPTAGLPLGGTPTALAAGDVGLRDGLADLVVGVAGDAPPEARVVVFQSNRGARNAAPIAFAVPEPAAALSLGTGELGRAIDVRLASGGLIRIERVSRSWRLLELPDAAPKARAAAPAEEEGVTLPVRIDRHALGRIALSSEGVAPVVSAPAATFVVDVTTDLNDAAPGDGVCADANGDCSLRAAIQEANAHAGADTIGFAIPGGGVPSIPVGSLPNVTETVTIDGTTQAAGRVAVTGTSNGFLVTLAADGCTVRGLVLNGNATTGLRVQSSNNVIEGNFVGTTADGTGTQGSLAVTGINLLTGSNNRVGGTVPAARNVIAGGSTAVRVDAGSGHLIEGNYIGTDVTGTVGLGGTADGVRVFGASATATIGGSGAGAGNVVSGYAQAGVELDQPGSVVQGNRIGTNAAGDAAIPNGTGISGNFGGDMTIGGTAPGAGNLVSGNAATGVDIQHNASAEIVIQGNRIGIDAAGSFAIPNEGYGLRIVGASQAQIGGSSPGAGNVISGNLFDGIFFTKFATVVPTGNTIQGNFIGTDATGTASIANLKSGIALEYAENNLIGGAAAGEGNVISGNFLHGIDLTLTNNTVKNSIYGNRIGTNAFGTGPLGNGLAGIFIPLNTHGAHIGGTGAGQANTIAYNGGAGVASDGGRALHVAPNSLYDNGGLGLDLFNDGVTPNRPGATNNFPVVTLANDIGGGTSVAGFLDAKAATSFDIHIFSSLSCDAAGHGEGREYRKTLPLTTDANGHGSFLTTITPAIPAGRYVTAYAVAPGTADDTSEFSFCRQLAGGPPPDEVPLDLFAVTPGHGGNTGAVTIRIAGQGMVAGTTARLERAGSADRVASAVSVSADGTTSTATFDLAGAALGAWDVTVTIPGDTKTLPAAFTVETGTKAEVWTDVIGRGTLAVRAGREQTFFLVYGNNGNVDSPPTQLRLTVPWQLQVTFVDTIDGVSPVVALDRPVRTGGTGQTWISFYLKTVRASTSGTLAVRVKAIAAQPGEYGEKISFKVWHMTTQGLAYLFDDPPDPSVTVTPQVLVDQPDHFQATLHVSNGVLSGDLDYDATFGTSTFESRPLVTRALQGSDEIWSFGAAWDPIAPPLPDALLVETSRIANDGFIGSISQVLGGSPQFTKMLVNAVSSADFQRMLEQNGTIDQTLQGLGSPGLPADLKEAAALLSTLETGLPTPAASPGAAPAARASQADVQRRLADLEKLQKEARDLVEAQRKVERDTMETLDETCGCPSTNPLTLTCPDPVSDVHHDDVHVFQAIDPNEKSGPTGAGAARYIDGAAPLAYTITFENVETASGPAQEVVVTDPIDGTKLDLATFALGPINFGTHVVTPPPGLQAYTADVDLRPGIALIARVSAGIDLATGVATWHFFSLDPDTGQPTGDPALGFLPPNVNTPDGEGHVAYTIRAKSGQPSGTEIHNQAAIVFDANPAIDTDDWTNTIDTTPPSSQVSALPGSSCSAIEVQWSGADAHSGVRSYDVYVAENGGVFVPWRTQTDETSAVYYGSIGSSYAFYSVARDAAGNEEAPPGAADATTMVGFPTPLTDSLAPTSGPATGSPVLLTGSGYAAGASVTVGGAAATGVVVNDPTSLSATFPALAPGELYDVVVQNPGGCAGALEEAWLADFLDVPSDDIFHASVEKIARRKVTVGCGNGLYCIERPVTRAEMAVFLIKGKYNLALTPPPATGSLFGDVHPGDFAADFIEQLANEGITAGCGNGNYCPSADITRAEMAVFLLKSEHGPLYQPPPATGTVFDDVHQGDFAADWIEQLHAEGITGGCDADSYCPGNPVTRGQMAAFLSLTFGF